MPQYFMLDNYKSVLLHFSQPKNVFDSQNLKTKFYFSAKLANTISLLQFIAPASDHN